MISKILRALGGSKYGLDRDHPFRSSFEHYFADVVAAANADWGRSAYDLLAPEKYPRVRPSTLLRSGGGLWKRIAQNWEVADFCASDPASYNRASKAAIFVRLAYNEAFLLAIAIESGLWETWIPRSCDTTCIRTPPTMIFDERFDFSKHGMPRIKLPEALKYELKSAAAREHAFRAVLGGRVDSTNIAKRGAHSSAASDDSKTSGSDFESVW